MGRVTLSKLGALGHRCLLRAASVPLKLVLPIEQNKAVFSAFSGHGYSCSPKYVLEELHRKAPDMDFVWLTVVPDSSIPEYVRQVPYGTLQMVREYVTARIWVDNTRGEKCVRKRRGQFYVQTWHAYCGPKKAEKDAGNMSLLYQHIAKCDAADTDCMISDNDLEAKKYRSSFWYSGPVVRCGIPRNKPLLHPNPEIVATVRSNLEINDKAMLCLYAPTFRKGGNQPAFSLDYEKVRASLAERFGRDVVMVVRLHPNERERSKELPDDVIDASYYPDGQELLAAADVLITDFSSVAEDFILTGRPGFMYVPDYDRYLQEERGMYYPITKRPFALAKSQDELVRAIKGYSGEDYARRRQEFFDFIGFEDNGHGDQAVADIILSELAKGGADGNEQKV